MHECDVLRYVQRSVLQFEFLVGCDESACRAAKASWRLDSQKRFQITTLPNLFESNFPHESQILQFIEMMLQSPDLNTVIVSVYSNHLLNLWCLGIHELAIWIWPRHCLKVLGFSFWSSWNPYCMCCEAQHIRGDPHPSFEKFCVWLPRDDYPRDSS